jgi:hypothetical protein
MAAQSRRTRRNSSTLSRKHQVVEQEVSSDELNIGVLYNVTERIIIPRPVHSKHSKTKLPDEFEIISYIGECSQPFPKFVRFKVPIGGGKTEERLVDKADIVHLSKFDFPGLFPMPLTMLSKRQKYFWIQIILKLSEILFSKPNKLEMTLSRKRQRTLGKVFVEEMAKMKIKS